MPRPTAGRGRAGSREALPHPLTALALRLTDRTNNAGKVTERAT